MIEQRSLAQTGSSPISVLDLMGFLAKKRTLGYESMGLTSFRQGSERTLPRDL